jgi:hypothetical protein
VVVIPILPKLLNVKEDSYAILEDKFNSLIDYVNSLHLRVAELERPNSNQPKEDINMPIIDLPKKKVLKKRGV